MPGYLLRTRGVTCRSQYKNIHTYTRCDAEKVKLAPSGKLNTQEGLIHYKRKRDGDDDDDADGVGNQA